MRRFVYSGLPSRVIFGSGTRAQLAAEIDALGVRRALILATPQQRDDAERVASEIGARAVGVFSGAVMHTPVEVTSRALAMAAEVAADVTVALGGGSTIGLGKALALRTDLPQIAVPTTYAGSEMTPIIGETKDGSKTTQRTLKVLPEVVIYDVDLTLSLPVKLSVTSGINAIAHAVEALYAQDRNPIISLMAEDATAALVRALPRIAANPSDRDARADALYGAWLCGVSLGSVGMALHHKLCHTLGGAFDLPHAETHTVILPHVIAYNASAAPDALASLRRALNTDNPSLAVHGLAKSLGAPTALRELGMSAAGVDTATDLALATPYWNPRPLDKSAIRDLLQRAYDGSPPVTSPN